MTATLAPADGLDDVEPLPPADDPTTDPVADALRDATNRVALDRLDRLADSRDDDDPDVSPLDWQRRALCAQTDPEEFYPEKGGSTAAAKRVCYSCPVRLTCLDYALENDERFGIWGGLSERERRRVKKAAV